MRSNSIIVLLNRLDEALWARQCLNFQLLGQLLDRVGGHTLHHIRSVFFLPQPLRTISVPNLERYRARLFQDLSSKLRVREVPHINALVDKAVAICIKHQAEGIPALCELIC